jgi:glycosyltransferase involved in cell wall biosynthesis
MYQPRRLCLIIPCYNEPGRLPGEEFRRHLQSQPYLHLVFVDDGSKDDTLGVLRNLCEGFESRTTILSYGLNQGKAEAVRTGINHAMAELQPDLVGFWDADLATPLEELKAFLEVIERRPQVTMIFGARVKLLGRDIVRLPSRHYLGRVFATVASQMLRIPIYATQCGAKLFRVTPYLQRVFEQRFLSRWIFDIEIVTRFQRAYDGSASRLEQVLYEHPLSTWVDVAGSKVRPKHFFIALLDMLRIARQRRSHAWRTAVHTERAVPVPVAVDSAGRKA